MKTTFLVPDRRYTNEGNLVFFATYLTEHFENRQRLAIKIPSAIYNSTDKNEFNQCFTDILVDRGFNDVTLIIKISDSELFEVSSY
jgi:hypothetical protein